MKSNSFFRCLACLAILLTSLPAMAQSPRVVLTPSAGYSISWDGNNGGYSSAEPGAAPADNIALASNGTTPFGSSELDFDIHYIININDGFYGNSSSWIAKFTDPADTNPFVGLTFSAPVAITNVAWSRDNGDATEPSCAGTCMDRAVGIYTLQITRLSAPGVDTPETGDPATGWATIGTVEYTEGADNSTFSAYLRHRFDLAADGQPISATGLRLKLSNNTIAIDELEVNVPLDPVPPIGNFITITNAPGYNIVWDGNNGAFFSESSPAPAPANRALASNGTTAFGSSEFGAGVHLISNVNDGLYGNSRSWIPNFNEPADPNPYIGLNFGGTVHVNNIAWGRDNGDSTDCCGGQLTDRALGVYTVQFTQAANPGAATAETGDPASGWAPLGTIHFKSDGTPFTSYLRHRFDLSTTNGTAIPMTGLRIKVPAATTAIDEIEVNVNVATEAGLLLLAGNPGFTISWDGNDGEFYNPAAGARAPSNAALAARGVTAFGSSELDYGIHFIRKINDGLYGNSSSWISANGVGGSDDADPFVGLAFGATVPISSIAWGRDNGDATEGGCGGTCLDRAIGIYTLQYTTLANPGKDTAETGDPATGWKTIGTVEYTDAAPPGFNPSRRHRFEVAAGGQPISATGLRLKVSSGNLAIDEIEVNPSAEVELPEISELLEIVSAPGFNVTWDGNDGEFQSADTNAAAPANLALASNGTTAFGSSEFGAGTHLIANINDGLYGNAESWIANFATGDNNPFIGLSFGKLVGIRSVAWGRDNGNNADCCGGVLRDRAEGLYTLQITGVANPGVDTPESGDPATGWVTVGTLNYKAGFEALFNPHLRHRYTVSAGNAPIPATGLRIKVSNSQMAIDEIEINPAPTADENLLVLAPAAGYSISWDGNNGDYSTTNSPALAPENAARASNGTLAFGSSEFGANGAHMITNVNDGLYGNSHSWISNFGAPDAEPFIGLNFGKSILIENIAWGRDNGDVAGDCCGGTLTDRTAGTYTLQVTTMPNPGVDTPESDSASSGWVNIGTVLYRGGGSTAFRHHLRHSYDVSLDGNPIPATGLRIKVPDVNTAIDEIEVNTQLPPLSAPAVLSLRREGTGAVISWSGPGILESTSNLDGAWAEVTGVSSPFTITASQARQFYRLKK